MNKAHFFFLVIILLSIFSCADQSNEVLELDQPMTQIDAKTPPPGGNCNLTFRPLNTNALKGSYTLTIITSTNPNQPSPGNQLYYIGSSNSNCVNCDIVDFNETFEIDYDPSLYYYYLVDVNNGETNGSLFLDLIGPCPQHYNLEIPSFFQTWEMPRYGFLCNYGCKK